MKDITRRPLFIFEMANNHMGSVEHGIKIVRAMRDASREFPFSFAVKLQYRDIDTFIHPDFKARTDLKFVKRFSETRLSWDEYLEIKREIDACGFVSICTPWDEVSVDWIERHDFDFIKVPSCYFTDWPLLERIIQSKKPVIASAGGAELEDVDRVVSFFQHRNKNFSLLHCVGQYPTANESLNLNQIDLFKRRYPAIEIGFSTHEPPDNYDAVKIAIGKGATIFEKHVGVPAETIKLNVYSATPEQVHSWLQAAAEAYAICGVTEGRCAFQPAELATLRDLQRGVFAKGPLKSGEKITAANTFLAIPNQPGQLVANDLSKYSDFHLTADLEAGAAVAQSATEHVEKRHLVRRAVERVKQVLRQSGVVVPSQMDLEISHHYGLNCFERFGSTIITVVNREYCKRVIVLLPGQSHPEQYHKQKDETYHILYGEISLKLDGVERQCKANDVIIIPRGVRHSFTTAQGVVIEEISSSYSQGDSFYTDTQIEKNLERKTYVTYWMD
jgi:sialic acid synthase SpsE/mannose-6-phosphate isomerase-like protein (cupin superfamily)